MAGYFKTYNVAKTQNPNYIIHLSCPGAGFELICDMPEEQSNAVGSEWEALLPSSVKDYLPSFAGQAVQGLLGTNGVIQSLTQQVWVNSSPIEIPLTILFDAQKSAKDEVWFPMRALELLAMPTIGVGSGAFSSITAESGVLISPGPNRAVGFGESQQVELHFGHLQLPSVIVVGVSSTYSSKLDADGFPIAGKVDLQLKTDRVLSRQNWATYTGLG